MDSEDINRIVKSLYEKGMFIEQIDNLNDSYTKYEVIGNTNRFKILFISHDNVIAIFGLKLSANNWYFSVEEKDIVSNSDYDDFIKYYHFYGFTWKHSDNPKLFCGKSTETVRKFHNGKCSRNKFSINEKIIDKELIESFTKIKNEIENKLINY